MFLWDNIVILVENGLVPRTKRAASGAFRVKAEADFQVELLYSDSILMESVMAFCFLRMSNFAL